MLKIYYLKLTQIGYTLKPHLHNHYILLNKTKFYVMTSNPVKNMQNYLISNFNIEQKFKNQYLTSKAHIYDPMMHILQNTSLGDTYLIEHQEKFMATLKLIESLTNGS